MGLRPRGPRSAEGIGVKLADELKAAAEKVKKPAESTWAAPLERDRGYFQFSPDEWEYIARCSPATILTLCTALEKAEAALKPFAEWSVDFIPTHSPFRRYIMQAREALKGLE